MASDIHGPLRQIQSANYLDLVTVPEVSYSKVPSETGSRKKKRKKLLRKRQSLVSSSYTDVSHEMASSFESSGENGESYSSKTRLPGINREATPNRINILSSPNPRQPGQVVSSQAHERRKKVPLLAAIKPENERAEKDRFMRANFNYNPLFIYRTPAEPEVLSRFTNPSDKYMSQAKLIMDIAIQRYGSYEIFEEQSGGRILTRPQILCLVKRFLRKEDLESEICLNLSEDLISRGSMTRSKGRPVLNVRVVNLREQWAEGLLRHEIGTHYLRSLNNRYQPWNNFKTRRELGLKPLNPTEEGLASLHSVLFRPDPSLWRAALLYYTAFKASEMSFKELFRDLGQFVHDPNVRWDYCIRAKRGQVDTSLPGGFCKDQVYLEGALQILKRRRTINFSLLLKLGKIAHEDIEMLEEYADLENTRIPNFMHNMTIYRQHVDRIAQCNGLTDQVLADVD
ncbi:putative tyrosine carboxypeptidase MATCAP2 [Haliotis asinina]|uniref:putative tyrosine carboxypeptidase MATCAP2 n=1 Tax=Haliotis asinina TaxID=109174 RepID=UPI003531903F